MKEEDLYIVIPCYNDWESLDVLLGKIDKQKLDYNTNIIVVNDNSTIENTKDFKYPLLNITIVNLIRNLGHQKAIAIGLSYVHSLQPATSAKIVIMDSDGEDKPEAINDLLSCSNENSKKIIFAKRRKRFESFSFRFFYKIYKWTFKLLTGHTISFGNFSLIPATSLKYVVNNEDIWNHYSGAIIKSKIPYYDISLDRGKRYVGKSKMNFTSLILHGLSSISVHLETVAIRLLIMALLFISGSIIYVISVLLQKYVFLTAIPGWTSTVSVGVISISLQSFLIILVLAFLVLSKRNQGPVIPAKIYSDLIDYVSHIK